MSDISSKGSQGKVVRRAPCSDAPAGKLVGSATVRAPGVCGELVQGMLDESYFLVTCPVDFFSRVRVELYQESSGVGGPRDCPKAVAAVQAALAYLEREELSARLAINNPIPRSKGMGSSSADVTATIAATALALGKKLSPHEIARLALSVEPTDGIMFPGIALFDHRTGKTAEELGPPPPMEIVALDFGGTVDTLEFNQVDRRALWRSIQAPTLEALQLVRQGIRKSDPGLVGRGASISSEASQEVNLNPQLPRVLEFAASAAAAGVCVGHSGTIIGVMLDARERRGKSIFRQARETFSDAMMVHHFRLLGGGMRLVL